MGTYYKGLLFYGVDITGVVPDNAMDSIWDKVPDTMEVVITGCNVTCDDSRYYIAWKKCSWSAYQDEPIDLGNIAQKTGMTGGYDELYEFCQSLGMDHPEPNYYLACERG